MSDTTKLSIDFGPEAGTATWSSIDEFLVWLQKQSDAWSWIAEDAPRNAARSQAWLQLGGKLSQIRRSLEPVMAGQDDAANQRRSEEAFHETASDVRAMFAEHPWLHPSSSRHAFIEDVRRRKGALVAATIIALWMNIPFGPDDKPLPVAQAALEAELFDRGAPPRLEWETESYAQIIRTLSADRASHLSIIQEGLNKQNRQAAEFVVAEQGRSDGFDKAQAMRNSQWETALNEAQSALHNIKDAYDKHMSLAAPVAYWEGKQKRHFKWMVWSGTITAVLMVASAILLHCELSAVAEKATAAAAASMATGVKQDGIVGLMSALATWRLGSFILLATLAFWVLRLGVRVFLSNMHLENDAAERVTMVKTYLSLIRDGKLTGDSANLAAILAALFRPTGDGIVKDEGIPPNFMELLTKLK